MLDIRDLKEKIIEIEREIVRIASNDDAIANYFVMRHLTTLEKQLTKILQDLREL